MKKQYEKPVVFELHVKTEGLLYTTSIGYDPNPGGGVDAKGFNDNENLDETHGGNIWDNW